jgi:hypothetical protein
LGTSHRQDPKSPRSQSGSGEAPGVPRLRFRAAVTPWQTTGGGRDTFDSTSTCPAHVRGHTGTRKRRLLKSLQVHVISGLIFDHHHDVQPRPAKLWHWLSGPDDRGIREGHFHTLILRVGLRPGPEAGTLQGQVPNVWWVARSRPDSPSSTPICAGAHCPHPFLALLRSCCLVSQVSQSPRSFLSPARIDTCTRTVIRPFSWGAERQLRLDCRGRRSFLYPSTPRTRRGRCPYASLNLSWPEVPAQGFAC